MKRHRGWTGLFAFALVAVGALPALAAEPDAAGIEFFEKKIRPVLAARCYKCHSAAAAEKQELRGGLRLDTRAGVRQGGESGPAVVPGKPEESLLLSALRHESFEMPPDGKLPDAVIADFARWIARGAADPRDGAAAPATTLDLEAAREFWSFRPVRSPAVPAVKNSAWVENGIDRFVLARLEAAGLAPAPPAEKRTLLRRVYFDLIGLPPTPEQTRAFVEDDAPDALARVVDRLLASPHYGERWGRHWLDVVRYADSKDTRGLGGAADIAAAWRYRDWVVEAFNRDLPYDRFVIDQIAGDLDPTGGDRRAGIVATGMLAIGAWEAGGSDKRKMMTDIVDDQIDVVSRGFLGLTIACARCHDHKFDPIENEDYYALAGIFFSSHVIPAPGDPTAGSPMLRIPLLSPEQKRRRERAAARAPELERQIGQTVEQHRAALAEQMRARLADYLTAAGDVFIQKRAGEEVELDRLAAARDLRPALLRRWMEYSALDARPSPPLELFTEKFVDSRGGAPLRGWRSGDLPSLYANASDKAVKLLTFTVPPRSVAAHPSPQRAVAVAWKSPLAGNIKISGRVADGDANCGNGVRWSIRLRQGGGATELTGGAYDRGGNGAFEIDALAKEPLAVAAGDCVALVVDPRDGEHACDTTIIELRIETTGDAPRVWSLTRDVIDDIQAGNPHADSLGSAGVWRFGSLAASGQTEGRLARAGSALATWVRAVRAGNAPPDELRRLAEAVGQSQQGEPPPEEHPDAALRRDLQNADGAFWQGVDVAALLPAEAGEQLRQRRAELAALQKLLAEPAPFAQGIQEGGVPGSEHEGIHDVRIHIRGRYDRLGKQVPRRLPALFAGRDQTPLGETTDESGRRELAAWIAGEDNPLTARVMVNRIWQHHFGRGLVGTPGNFGEQGERPTHPKLLDWLAARFVASGWSVKAMHRLILLSAAYRQSSRASETTLAADPDNRLLGRANRRRLEAEAIRDAMLAAAGRLDLRMGGPAARDLNSPRRTLYLMTIRSESDTFQRLFDAADPTSMIHARGESTVAPQALFFMNHPFVLDQARALAERMTREGPADAAGRIAWLYELLYGRPPRAEEIEIGKRLIGDGAPAKWEQYAQVLLCANEFMYLD